MSADGRTMAITIGGAVPRVEMWRPGSSTSPRRIAAEWGPEHLAVSPDGETVAGVEVIMPEDIPTLRAYTIDGERLSAPYGKAAPDDFYPGDVEFTDDGRLLVVVSEWAGPRVGHRGRLQQVDLGNGHRHHAEVLRDIRKQRPDRLLRGGVRPRRLRGGRLDGPAPRVPGSGGRRAPGPAPTGAAGGHQPGVRRYTEGSAPVLVGRGGHALRLPRASRAGAGGAPGSRAATPWCCPVDGAAVTLGEGGQVELWSINSRTGHWSLGESLVGHSGAAEQVDVSHDGRTLLTAARDGQLITWDLTPATGFGTTYPGLRNRWVSNRMGVIDPGRLVVAPTRTRTPTSERGTSGALAGPGTRGVSAVFLDPRDGRVVDQVPVGRTVDAVFGSSVAVSPDRRSVAVTSGEAVTVLDTRTRDRVVRLPLPLSGALWVWSAGWSPDGSMLLLGTEGDGVGEVLVVDTETWQVVRRFQPHWGSAQVLEWAPDGETLAVGVNYAAAIGLYDADLRHLRTVELGEGGDVFDLSFSPDGRYLAAGRSGGGVDVLDTGSWRPVHETASMHTGHVNDVEWLPDSSTVVSTGRDELISLYDVRRDLVRASPLPASGTTDEGQSFLLPAPEDEVVVFNDDGPGHVYPLDPAQWLAQACMVAGRDLTRAEWDRYLPDTPYYRVCDLGS